MLNWIRNGVKLPFQEVLMPQEFPNWEDMTSEEKSFIMEEIVRMENCGALLPTQLLRFLVIVWNLKKKLVREVKTKRSVQRNLEEESSFPDNPGRNMSYLFRIRIGRSIDIFINLYNHI